MNTYTVDPLRDPRWTQFLDRHPRASVFHTPGWLRALERSYNYKPVVYTTTPPGQELTNGIVFCKVDSWISGRRLVSLPFSDHCEPLVNTNEELEFLTRSMMEFTRSEGRKYVEIRPLRAIEPERNGGLGLAQSKSFYMHTVDLRPDLDKLFRSLHNSEQRKIRRAGREGLTCEEGRSAEFVQEFYRLFMLTRRRHRIPPQPLQWFKNLAECLADMLTIRIAYKDGRPIASVLTLSFKESVVYKYGCSDHQFHKLGAMQLLLWQTIQKGKENGADELDLGRSDIDQESLANFKDHWASTRSQLNYYRYPPPIQGHAAARGWTVTAARYAFARLPDSLLIAVGKLLYPHVG